jgi:hypothetical protein
MTHRRLLHDTNHHLHELKAAILAKEQKAAAAAAPAVPASDLIEHGISLDEALQTALTQHHHNPWQTLSSYAASETGTGAGTGAGSGSGSTGDLRLFAEQGFDGSELYDNETAEAGKRSGTKRKPDEDLDRDKEPKKSKH